jgi:uncharacterized FlaG/YvyC family protein
MDVPATTLGPTLPAAAPQPAPAPAPEPAPAATAVAAGLPPSTTTTPIHSTGNSQPGAASDQQSDSTLSPVVAKLFNAAEQNVTVSFQVTTDPDEVVTVFTDKSTGKEIVQFPSQALIALAEMYDKDAGKVLDKNA